MMQRWRLFPKYALLIIGLVTLMLLASGAVGLYFSHRENRDHLVALQREKAQGAATRIEQYVLDLEHQLSWTALPRLDGAATEALEARRIEYLKLLRQTPAITEVVWIDAAGREQLRVSRLAMDTLGSGTDVSQLPKFREASAGRAFFGPVYFRKDTEPYMTIARPADSSGGVTAAEVNLKFVWDVVSRIRIGEKGLAYVIDADGTLIAHPDISLVLKKTELATLPQVAALASKAAFAPDAAHNLHGEPVLTGFARIPTLGWTVFVESPRAEAFAPLYVTLQRMALVLVAALLVSMAASFYLARALVRPLRALQQGAAQIGAGELDRRIEVRTGDELEGLAEQFNQMGAALKASYAGLERKVELRTAELSEALDYQTAISAVLRVISISPTDVAPVFEAILDSASRLLGTPLSAVFRYDGKLVHQVAVRNWPAAAVADARRFYPGPPNPGMMSGRAILSGEVQVEEDTLADPDYDQTSARLGLWRRMVAAPLLKDGTAIGAIVLAWREPGGTPQRQVDLLKTFADQAVIAIENVRLINETREALEQQTATAEILQVISRSPTDVQPVFDAIAERAKVLCEATVSGVTRFDGDLVHLVAFHGASPEANRAMLASFPMRAGRGAITARAIAERAPVQIADVLADPDYTLKEATRLAGYRSNLAVPMLREGQVVGSIGVCRTEPGVFPDKQVKLLQTFADQAVIAIENVRLFNETREALERQTATAEILRVISGSPTSTEPVFEAILASGARLCEADMGLILRYEAEKFQTVATLVPDPAFDAFLRQPIKAGPDTGLGRIARTKAPVHIPDLIEDDAYRAGDPLRLRSVELGGVRTWLGVPMLREGELIGALAIYRKEVRPFARHQIDVLSMFADQAVIAVENVRLFNETKEALEQQTATAEVLRVIGSSVADTQPVFEKILHSCQRLFESSEQGIVLVGSDGIVRLGAHHGSAREKVERLFPQPQLGGVVTDAMRAGRVLHFPDVVNGEDVPPALRAMAKQLDVGNYSQVFAPLMWEGRHIGTLYVIRQPPVGFTDKESGLLKTFADQAAIAIENARLFHEIEDKSRQLELANKHKSEFLANMSHELRTPLNAIIGFSEVLSEQMFGEINDKQREYLLDIHGSGHHLLTLINDILDLSKIEAGRMELELTNFNLPMLLDNTTTLVRERAARQGLTLALEVDPALDDWVADVRKLKQVVINLLSNAVKFTPAGGRVTLRARRLDGAVEIAVVDTGVGIAPDQQAMVFEEFRQASGSYLRKSEGTGLGLALAKRFVELHGGTIRVESAPGHGSTFAFVLPHRVLEVV